MSARFILAWEFIGLAVAPFDDSIPRILPSGHTVCTDRSGTIVFRKRDACRSASERDTNRVLQKWTGVRVAVPRLTLRCDGFGGGSVELVPGQLPAVLGRSHAADITISDPHLSRRHAEIRINAAGQFEIVDLDSTNLTIVNTQDVPSRVLRDGDQLLLGHTRIQVEIRLPPSDIHDKTTKELPNP